MAEATLGIKIYSLPDQWPEVNSLLTGADIHFADPFAGTRNIADQMKRCLLEYPSPDRQAVSALIENEYIVRDYLDAYQEFYSRTFHDLPRYCQRIHFFSTRLTED